MSWFKLVVSVAVIPTNPGATSNDQFVIITLSFQSVRRVFIINVSSQTKIQISNVSLFQIQIFSCKEFLPKSYCKTVPVMFDNNELTLRNMVMQ